MVPKKNPAPAIVSPGPPCTVPGEGCGFFAGIPGTNAGVTAPYPEAGSAGESGTTKYRMPVSQKCPFAIFLRDE